VHVVQACTEEKGLIDDELLAVRQDLDLLELPIYKVKARIEGEVSGVGGQMMVKQSMINEIRQGITMLQQQDKVIIKEAGVIFQGIHKEIHDSVKKQVENGFSLMNHRRSIIKLQEDVKEIRVSNISLSSKVEAIDKFVKT